MSEKEIETYVPAASKMTPEARAVAARYAEDPDAVVAELGEHLRRAFGQIGAVAAEGEALAAEFERKAETSRFSFVRWHYGRMAASLRRELEQLR
jgi:hypothetical protein